MYVVPGVDTDAVGRVHGERFGQVRPASTLVVVHALVRADLLIEIEVDAILPPDVATAVAGSGEAAEAGEP